MYKSDYFVFLLLVKYWYGKADEMVTVFELQSVNLSCPSYSMPTWLKLRGESVTEIVSNRSGNNIHIHSTVLMIVSPLSHQSGVYLCYGYHQNGTAYGRTFLLYIGCKLSVCSGVIHSIF